MKIKREDYLIHGGTEVEKEKKEEKERVKERCERCHMRRRNDDEGLVG